jgi:cytidylate kinase
VTGPPAAPVVVAIDGPSGVGKSTVARRVARELGLTYLDTGAMYRALGWKALRTGVRADDEAAVQRLVAESHLQLLPASDGRADLRLDGEEVEPHIRSQDVAEMASRLAALAVVRHRMVELQRAFGERYGAVLEGRDIGTVVFPHTRHKFFLDARPEVRVGRRVGQLHGVPAAPDDPAVARVAAEIEQRDRRDRERAESPLVCDSSYEPVDTSDLTPDEVVARLVEAVRGGGVRSRADHSDREIR